ncbi:MAG: hypothetical protein D6687_03630 [Acidobacteria bacterium]|nr:MAG: hypothetical protein D6687_03630 [Acidobacteriota bacterium]
MKCGDRTSPKSKTFSKNLNNTRQGNPDHLTLFTLLFLTGGFFDLGLSRLNQITILPTMPISKTNPKTINLNTIFNVLRKMKKRRNAMPAKNKKKSIEVIGI